MSEKERLAEIEKLKESMISKMNQAKLKGGLSNRLIRGCCTQGCCDGDPKLDGGIVDAVVGGGDIKGA